MTTHLSTSAVPNRTASQREADRDLQLLRHSDPLEAFERANTTGAASARPNPWPSVSVAAFWLRAAMLLGVVALVLLRVFAHR
jgi:hypothetical protein